MKVLVTGSAGVVGGYVCRQLHEAGHAVRAFDIVETPANRQTDDVIVGDLADADAVDRAVEGCDAVVHLGAVPDDAPYVKLLIPANAIGVYHVCESARKHNVARLVLASSAQACWNLPWRERVITVSEGSDPQNHYALLKVYAELMGRMYARMHGMSILAVRIGWLPRDQQQVEELAAHPAGHCIYFSGPDAGRFFLGCVEAPAEKVDGFQVLLASSRCDENRGYDLEKARHVIGYESQDTYPDNQLAHMAW